MSRDAYICDAVRTPFGRYGGALSSVRADDLGAIPIAALMTRNASVDWEAVSDVLYGCANQAGEDNRNVARMSSLLAGLPIGVPGATINRLCGTGLNALGSAARAIKSGEASLMIAGGVESMSRAPFVMPKAESAFSRAPAVYDTTIGWRFVNALMKSRYGVDSKERARGLQSPDHLRVDCHGRQGWPHARRPDQGREQEFRLEQDLRTRHAGAGYQRRDGRLRIELMVKDLTLACRLGMECGAPMMITNEVRSAFESGANELGGDANIDEMARLYEARAGIKFAKG